MNQFANLEKIGEGGYGDVYKAVDKTTGKMCALKRIKKIDQPALAEVEALERVKGHPNVANIQTYFIARGSLWVVTGFCEFGDLNRYVWEKRPDIGTRFRFMKQMSSAVSFLHDLGIAHRDLKPENVLIGRDGNAQPLAQLTDFGIAKLHCGNQMTFQFMTTCAGTAFFIAPEILLSEFGGLYTVKADVFSLGVIFKALVFECGLPCGEGGSKYLVDCFIVDGQPVPYGQALVSNPNLHLTVAVDLLASPNARKLMDGMVHRHPDQRLSARAVHDELCRLTADDFRETTASSPQAASTASSETTTIKYTGAQLVNRLTATVRRIKPELLKSAEALCNVLAAEYSRADLIAMRQQLQILYVTIWMNASPVDKTKLQEYVVPVVQGLEKIIDGEKLSDTEAVRFAVGMLQCRPYLGLK